MREFRTTHFEKIPLEVVKKIVDGRISDHEETSTDNVIVQRTSEKRRLKTAPARSLARKLR
jgi:hypothetical protein